MPHTFSPIRIDTIQGDDITTEVIGHAVVVTGSHVVNLDPDGARALAAALLEAADEAGVRADTDAIKAAATTAGAAELADPDAYCRTCGFYHSPREAAEAARIGRCPRWAPADAADKPGGSPDDYRHVAAWGRFLMSTPSYARGQQHEAFRDRAPVDAIYRSHDDGRWITAREVTNQAAIAALAEAVK